MTNTYIFWKIIEDLMFPILSLIFSFNQGGCQNFYINWLIIEKCSNPSHTEKQITWKNP